MLSENIGDIRLVIMAGGLFVQILADLGKEEEAHNLGEQVLRDADDLQHIQIQVLTRHSIAYALLQKNQIGRLLSFIPSRNNWSSRPKISGCQ